MPDLAPLQFAADSVPAGQALLLCLFDASQRPSRHVARQLDQQVAALRQRKVVVLGIQAASISDEQFNEWKSSGGVSFPVGRVGEAPEKVKWVTGASALPWLILTDANRRVIAEGFTLDELDNQMRQLAK